MSHSQFHSIKVFTLRHAWLNLWDKHMTTGRINQITILHRHTTPKVQSGCYRNHKGLPQAFVYLLVRWNSASSRYRTRPGSTYHYISNSIQSHIYLRYDNHKRPQFATSSGLFLSAMCPSASSNCAIRTQGLAKGTPKVWVAHKDQALRRNTFLTNRPTKFWFVQCYRCSARIDAKLPSPTRARTQCRSHGL